MYHELSVAIWVGKMIDTPMANRVMVIFAVPVKRFQKNWRDEAIEAVDAVRSKKKRKLQKKTVIKTGAKCLSRF
jgi:hypothetical protein